VIAVDTAHDGEIAPLDLRAAADAVDRVSVRVDRLKLGGVQRRTAHARRGEQQRSLAPRQSSLK
jgi:hypothetical protein